MSVRLTVEALGARGDGVAYHDGGTVYVGGALPGDIVEANLNTSKKGAVTATDIRVIEQGNGHQAPPCSHFGTCGGCAVQHMSDATLMGWLKDRVTLALAQQGIAPVPTRQPHLSPPGTRRRATFRYIITAKGVVFGFNAERSHNIVDLKACPVVRGEVWGAAMGLKASLPRLLPPGAKGEAHISVLETGVAVVLKGAFDMDDPDVLMDLSEFAIEYDLAALWVDTGLGPEPIAERRTPTVSFGGVDVRVPPGAFLQATADGETALLAAVQDGLEGAKSVLDAFSGLGTFALGLSSKIKVTAMDVAGDAISALQLAVGRAPRGNVTAEHRDLFRRPVSGGDLNVFDAVILDPPRAGAEAQCRALAASNVPTVMAVSCNPNTFARDAKILIDGGYRLEWVQPVGQFLWSTHMELVARFSKP